jgi:hypothetical protein
MMPITLLRPSSINEGYYQVRFVFAIEQSEPYTGSSRSDLAESTMEITKRLIGTSGILKEAEPDLVGVDLDSIIRRLILFDTYILRTIKLQEFPFLVPHLGFDGTLHLLASPAFEIECECVTVGQTGQTALKSRLDKGVLPLLSYCLAGIEASDHEKYVHDCLQPLHQIPHLTLKQVIRLKRAVVDKIVRLPEGFRGRMLNQTRADVLGKPYLVMKSARMAIQQMLKVEPPEFSISVEAIDTEDIRVETDLSKQMGIDLPTAHRVIERGLLGVGGLTQRFAEMDAYSALSGFTESDLPLVDEQLKFLLRISPEVRERQFRRVVKLAGFPDFVPAIFEKRVKIERLLEIRESNECREFRDWLPTIENASDTEIKERIGSLRAKFGNSIQSYPGKAVRLLATTGIGSIPVVGPIAGLLAGLVDTFFLEKIFPKSGVVAFLSDLYPSVFHAGMS